MASNIALVPNLTAEGNLARYLDEIQKFPMLQANEEYMPKRWVDHEDTKVAHQPRDKSLTTSCKDSDGLSRIWPSSCRINF